MSKVRRISPGAHINFMLILASNFSKFFFLILPRYPKLFLNIEISFA